MRVIPPSYDAIRDARALAQDLRQIATGEKVVGAMSPTSMPSAADRLVVVAANLAEIVALLRSEYIHDEAPDGEQAAP